eukprot:scaffold918_cov168-Ochromonas_danica.AAC.1
MRPSSLTLIRFDTFIPTRATEQCVVIIDFLLSLKESTRIRDFCSGLTTGYYCLICEQMADNNDSGMCYVLFEYPDEKKEVENLPLENSDVNVHLMEEEEKQRMMEKENDENQPLTIMNAQNQLLEEKKDENQPKQNSLWYNPSVAKMTVDAIGETNARMAVGSATGIATGAYLGTAVVGGALFMIGLGPFGPVAGGWFAANMGAGLTA